MATAQFRFYAELNAFLKRPCRQRPCSRACPKGATVKNMIEAFGVPHTEVDLILADGKSVDFSHQLQQGERISVYPRFSSLGIAELTKLPLRPLRGEKFIADAHLGWLARHLRMLGFDVLYRNSYSDAEVARIAADEERIVLTRDRDLLMHKAIVRGCYLHAVAGSAQLDEVLARFDLMRALRPFCRCLNCNAPLREIAKNAVMGRVPPRVAQCCERFWECEGCKQVYWTGSHVTRMEGQIRQILGRSGPRHRATPTSKGSPLEPCTGTSKSCENPQNTRVL